MAESRVQGGLTADAVPRWVAPVAVAGASGVGAYVGAWLLAGLWTPGYDATRQAISELFALGAPVGPATLLRIVLIVSGMLTLGFAVALDRGLPGHGRAPAISAAISGATTALVVAVPCSSGCPGFGASLTDTLHVVVAGTSYATLVATPLLVARRIRGHNDRFARVSLVLGGFALLGFVVRNLGIGDPIGGLQQRVFNTTADLWYVLAAIVLVQRTRAAAPGRSRRA